MKREALSKKVFIVGLDAAVHGRQALIIPI